MHTNSRDEALALPSAEAARLALRTQQVIAEETGIPEHPDPFGGSYVIEKMTDDIAAEAQELIDKIDGLGGAVRAIEQGWIQNEIATSAYEHQRNIDSGKTLLVGVNKYVDDQIVEPTITSIDETAVQKQQNHVRQFMSQRDNTSARTQLGRLSKAASSNDNNLLPYIVDCVKNRCTLGEIADVLRSVFGEFNP